MLQLARNGFLAASTTLRYSNLFYKIDNWDHLARPLDFHWRLPRGVTWPLYSCTCHKWWCWRWCCNCGCWCWCWCHDYDYDDDDDDDGDDADADEEGSISSPGQSIAHHVHSDLIENRIKTASCTGNAIRLSLTDRFCAYGRNPALSHYSTSISKNVYFQKLHSLEEHPQAKLARATALLLENRKLLKQTAILTIPNSRAVGFQFLGLGLVLFFLSSPETKPWNPAVGLQSWII